MKPKRELNDAEKGNMSCFTGSSGSCGSWCVQVQVYIHYTLTHYCGDPSEIYRKHEDRGTPARVQPTAHELSVIRLLFDIPY